MFANRNIPLYGPDGAPQAGAPSGETTPQPQAGENSPANPQAGNGQNNQQPPAPTADDKDRIIAELRRENAGHRTKLKTFEEAEAKAKEAAMSELEKAQKQATDAQALAQSYQARMTKYEVMLAAQKLNIIDPDVAATLIAGALEYDADGTPSNVDELLKQLVKDKPYLVAQQQPPAPQGQQQQPRQPSMNPPRNRTTPAPNNQPFDYQNRPRLGAIWNKNNQ